jgi:hypothetical protein
MLVNDLIFADTVSYLRLVKLPRTGEARTVTGEDETMAGEEPIL